MKKRIVAMVLSLTIVLSGGVSTFAAEIENQSDTVETEKVELSGEESDISSESEDVTSTKNVQLDSQLNTDNEAEKVQLKLDESASEEKDASKPVAGVESEKNYGDGIPAASQSIVVNKKYYGELSTSDEEDCYKFTLNKAGHIRIDFGKEYDSNDSHGWQVVIYNSNWEIVKTDTFTCGNTKTDSSSVLGLDSGLYYVKVKQKDWYWTNVKYNFKIVYSNENVWETELNNSFAIADQIKVNNNYYGSISYGDSTDHDYYKFALNSDGHIRIDFGKEYDSNDSHGWDVILYSFDQEEMISWTFYCGNTKTDSTCEYGLPKGTYYILVKPRDYYDTNVTYNFKINFSASDAWEREPNDDLGVPNKINVNKTYYGTTTEWNDDCYTFNLRKNGTVSINFGKEYDSNDSHGWNITLYDSDRVQITDGTVYCGDTDNKAVISTDLSAGTYYLKVTPRRYYVSSVIYNFKITAKNEPIPTPAPTPSTVTAVSGFKIAGRAGNALRLSWNKNTSADGYIVEQYKSGSWTRIARIGSNSTVTYRVEKLSPSTKYNFRVKAFKLNGNSATYSSYKNISGITNPATISGLKIGGHAADALRLNWTKNSKVSGYIVEQYKGGKWTRIARIGENSTTTYRVEKLSASTTYKFRVQAFGFDGKTALYGNYAYINGKTSPATVTGIRIGGTAKDALRVNWNRDSKASGYIVQQYKNGTWVRIARIGNNNTTTYRVSGLKSGSTYIFRVQAFGYDGKTAIYDGFAMIPGTTK